MKQDQYNIDELLADVSELIGDAPPAAVPKAAPDAKPKTAVVKKNIKSKKMKKKQTGFLGKFFRFLGKLSIFLLETALILVIGLYGLMFVLAKGPSPTARDLFVMSVRETSAMGWVANLYFTDEELEQIENRKQVEDYNETDTSLIQIPKETEPAFGDIPEEKGPQADAWGLVDEDGDGIIIEEVKGEGYSGYMMVVLDPSRVIVGSVPESYGKRGYTVSEMVEKFDAVAGTNAGGFDDPNGTGNGSVPETLVVFEGKEIGRAHV